VPRVTLPGSQEVAVPQPLSPSQAVRVRRIFAAQAAGDFAQADRDIQGLDAPWLLGSILADRYLDARFHPSAEALTAWLAQYGDQPQAAALRNLLHRLAPARPTLDPMDLPVGPAQGRGPHRSARALFIANRDAEAMAAARTSPRGAAGADALLAGGLAALRLHQPVAARSFLDAAFQAAGTAASRAAAAFWLARVAEQADDRGDRMLWLRQAAQETGTFYGELARRVLDPTPACIPAGDLSGADLDLLMATPAGRRAFALLQVGQRRWAEAELRALRQDTWPDPNVARALTLAVRVAGLHALVREFAWDGLDSHTRRPVPPLRPNGGFVVEPPLVYALVWHESNFHAAAISQAGARGLMQIMPNTAVGIGALPAGQTDKLHDPAVNLAVGQRYLLVLAADKSVRGNLLRMLAAYAQGLAGMKSWADAVNDGGDPLMFLEAIPNRAIAGYIESALLAAWRYAGDMGLPPTGLDALRANTYPVVSRYDPRGAADPGRCASAPNRW
jgi:soluble lytic murein transglycosylase-like protein